ncbi:MAG: cytochrome P450 [Myxococcota bacterium]|nr:cytochrome P450 [Myxococcota bacterium]
MEPRAALSLDEIDLSAPEFWVRPWEEREAAFQTLRREKPMSFYAEPDTRGLVPQGPGYWAVTKHADILRASREPALFCSSKGATSIPDMPVPFLEFFGGFINMDDPKHIRQRKLVSVGFTKNRLARLDHEVETAAREAIDAVIEKGACDFVRDLSAPFPIRIICEMMGIPRSQHPFVFDQTNVILGPGDPEYVPEGSDVAAAIIAAGTGLRQLMFDLAEHRMKNPTDDLTSLILHAEVDGDKLTQEDLASFFILLVAAGNETTRNAISHGMKALCDYPEQREIWKSNFDGVTKTAVEEIVRWASPVIFMRRTTTGPCELGGQELAEGEKLVLFYNSANRDEEVFEEPFRFDLRRTPNEHVGFGGPGPHFCLGANLARREIAIFFRHVFERMPDLEITGPPERLASNFIHGIKSMPCRFSPGPTSPQ